MPFSLFLREVGRPAEFFDGRAIQCRTLFKGPAPCPSLKRTVHTVGLGMNPSAPAMFSTALIHDYPVVFRYTPQKIFCDVYLMTAKAPPDCAHLTPPVAVFSRHIASWV